MRLDPLNVDPINDMLIKHVRHSSIHMHLSDSAWAFGLIMHGIGLTSQDHDLVVNTVVMVLTALVFAQVILINQCLSFLSEVLWVHHNGNGQTHVSLEHQASRRHTVGFMDANADCMLC